MSHDQEFADYFAVRSISLRRLAFALSGDWHLADDLVQHTFLQQYRHWRRLESETLDAYSRRTLVNAFLSHRRRYRREQVVAEPPQGVAPDVDPGGGEDVAAAKTKSSTIVVTVEGGAITDEQAMDIAKARELDLYR